MKIWQMDAWNQDKSHPNTFAILGYSTKRNLWWTKISHPRQLKLLFIILDYSYSTDGYLNQMFNITFLYGINFNKNKLFISIELSSCLIITTYISMIHFLFASYDKREKQHKKNRDKSFSKLTLYMFPRISFQKQ